MVKRSQDEPDDKAAERLRQFERARQAVPDQDAENENKDKKKSKDSAKETDKAAPDSADDEQKPCDP